ncbi:O-antigen ligase family protein [Clostridium tunisiense]|uniref:O-antigen ligase family protein n=1 Tax=Clostridium tunisiense TaxID=219748 RepID=UPI000301802D|nr:O-antigen ligase family protein [Clostridium tunisiense]
MSLKNISLIYEKLLSFLLIFLVIFIPYREVISTFTSPKVKLIPDIMILITFALYMIKSRFRIKLNLTDIFYAGFLILAFISTIFINNVGIKSYLIETRSIFIYYIVYFMLRHTNLDNRFYRIFSKGIIYNAIILSFLSFIEKITSKTLLFPSAWTKSIVYADNYLRVYGMFNNPNTFGAYLLFSIIIIFYLQRVISLKVNKIFYVFTLATLALTASRSSMIALGFFILVCFFIVDKMLMVRTFAATIIMAAAVMFIVNTLSVYYPKFADNINEKINMQINTKPKSSAVDRFTELSNPEIISKSKTDGRIFSVTKGIAIFKENPILGTGFGTYGDAASLIISPEQYGKYEIAEGFYADNEYIKVLVETGIVGTLVYILFLLSIIMNHRQNKLKVLSCLILGFLGMFYNIFEVQILSFLFWVMLTLPESKEFAIKG